MNLLERAKTDAAVIKECMENVKTPVQRASAHGTIWADTPIFNAYKKALDELDSLIATENSQDLADWYEKWVSELDVYYGIHHETSGFKKALAAIKETKVFCLYSKQQMDAEKKGELNSKKRAQEEITISEVSKKMKLITIFDLVSANPNQPLSINSFHSVTAEHELMTLTLRDASWQEISALLNDGEKAYLLIEKDSHDNNIGHIAALARKPEMLTALHKKDVDIYREKNEWGVLPLHFAILAQDELGVDGMVKELGEVGAKSYLIHRHEIAGFKDREGKEVKFSPNFLEWGILFGNQIIVDNLLEYINLEEADGLQNIVKGSNLGTLLHIAVRSNRLSLMHRLLEYKNLRDLINVEDEQGVTPLGLALLMGYLEMAELLVNYPGIDINHISYKQGWAILHWVIWQLQLASVKFLLAYHVDLNRLSTGDIQEPPITLASRKIQELDSEIAIVTSDVKKRELNNHKAAAKQIHTAVKNPLLSNPFSGVVRYFKSPHERRYTSLVLNGGGAKGILFPYALEQLQQSLKDKTRTTDNVEAPILGSIQRVAGTSAGSIAALFIAMGCDAQRLQSELTELDVDQDILEGKQLVAVPSAKGKEKSSGTTLGQVLDSGKAFIGNIYDRLHTKVHQLGALASIALDNGVISGDNFLDWVEKRIAAQLRLQDVFKEGTWDGTITFREWKKLADGHRAKGFKHLYIVVTQLSPEVKPLVLNTEFVKDDDWYVDVPIADGIRASMSIPLVFKPYQLRIRSQGIMSSNWPRIARTFIDGGLLLNYPLHEFDRAYYAEAGLRAPSQWSLGRRAYVNHNTLGLCLVASREQDAAAIEAPSNVKELLERVVNLYYNNEMLSNYREEDDKPRTIFLSCSEEVEEQGKKVKKEITTLDFHKLKDEQYVELAKKWSQEGVNDFLQRPIVTEKIKARIRGPQ